MASITAKRNQEKIADKIFKGTHFSKQEAIKLLALFKDNAKNDKLDRAKFRDILHKNFGLTDDILLDRVFRAFDKDNDSNVSMEEWVYGLSVFLRGSFEEQVCFCFDVYDLNGDGYISRDEINHMLKTCVKLGTEEDADESVKDLVDIVIRKMDDDHDGKLSLADFTEAVKEETLLLEAFGKCLPNCTEVETFSQLFT